MIRIESRTGFSLGSSGAVAKGESDMMECIHELVESCFRIDDLYRSVLGSRYLFQRSKYVLRTSDMLRSAEMRQSFGAVT